MRVGTAAADVVVMVGGAVLDAVGDAVCPSGVTVPVRVGVADPVTAGCVTPGVADIGPKYSEFWFRLMASNWYQ